MSFGVRLETIASLVPVGVAVVDVGTDHAYLPVLLAQQQKIRQAVATDIASGPCQAAENTVAQYGLGGVISVRQGNGLAQVTPAEAEVVAIAGMGGKTITTILEQGAEQLEQTTRLVLQPMNGERELRHWLQEHKWKIVDERLAYEANRFYVVMAAVPGVEQPYEDIYYEVGPRLAAERPAGFVDYVQTLLHKYQGLLSSMNHSVAAQESARYREFAERKLRLEEIIHGN